MWLVLFLLTMILALGVIERGRHQKKIDQIPLRINVNGIRGKSTVTRLITGILTEAGYRTVGKTTGTAARMIYWNQAEEAVVRGIEGPNIREQKHVVAKAVDLGAECLVCECMAVHPDYQVVFQEKWLQANLGVIVNVLEDHMDVMGPTLDEVAKALTATIPYHGDLVVLEGPYVPFFAEEAQKRHTRVHVARLSSIHEEIVNQFDYMVFPENVAIALTIADVLKVDFDVALRGMLKALPDPGVVGVWPLDKGCVFVNAFAANDAVSTLKIWDRVMKMDLCIHPVTVVMNCRADRADRTIGLVRDVLPYIPMDALVLIGQMTSPVVEAHRLGEIRVKQLLDLENQSTEMILHAMEEKLPTRGVWYGIGNIHGAAEGLCSVLKERSEELKRTRLEEVMEVVG